MYNGERLRHSFFGFGSARMKLARHTERRRFGGDDNQAFITLRRCCGRRSVSSLFTKNARPAFRRVSNVHRPARASRRSRETSARGLMPVMMRATLLWQRSRRAQSDFDYFLQNDADESYCAFLASKCGRPVLSLKQFQLLHPFPNPILIPGQDKYRAFRDVWGSATTEEHRPSLQARKEHQGRIHTTADSATSKVQVKSSQRPCVTLCSACSQPRSSPTSKRHSCQRLWRASSTCKEVLYLSMTIHLSLGRRCKVGFHLQLGRQSPRLLFQACISITLPCLRLQEPTACPSSPGTETPVCPLVVLKVAGEGRPAPHKREKSGPGVTSPVELKDTVCPFSALYMSDLKTFSLSRSLSLSLPLPLSLSLSLPSLSLSPLSLSLSLSLPGSLSQALSQALSLSLLWGF